MDISKEILEKYIADSLTRDTKKKRKKGKLIYPKGYFIFNIENRTDIRDIRHNFKVK